MRTSRLLVALVLAVGCGDSGPTDCPDAEARLGHRVCAHRIGDSAIWEALAAEVSPVDQVRTTRYLLPARGDARLPLVFEDQTAGYDGHYPFLRQAFGDRFAALTLDEYVELITDPARRELFAGGITEYLVGDGGRAYGYFVWDTQDEAGTITCADFQRVHAALAAGFDLAPLVAVPTTGLQRQVLAGCDLPSHDPSTALDYEVYSQGTGYGTIRRYTLDELATATAAAAFGFQDILVLDEAPFDIETIISGAITGTRQGELSHLNVRSAARGTPNCYVKHAHSLLESWEGQLVRIDCDPRELRVAPATTAEAEAWWASLRPTPVAVPTPDLDFAELPALTELPTASAAERATALARVGGKGANLAALYQRIPAALALDGFTIPFHYYDAFLVQHGLDTTIDALLSDPDIATDGALRRTRLAALRAAIEAKPCDAALLTALGERITTVFRSDQRMVRFRSSSNAEDSLAFSGAGLYDSTSACLADDLDGDALGPSRCDPDQPNERGLCRALTRVWASTWKPQAYDERAWYGMDQRAIAMAILVNDRSAGERANIVAFTGNPLGPDRAHYLVNAQLGELDVVSAAPGVWPEKDLLTIESGQVTAIERVRASTEVAPGEVVLTDAQLRELGAALANIAAIMPLDAPIPPGKRALFDTEWKLLDTGRLIIKQIRPSLDDAL